MLVAGGRVAASFRFPRENQDDAGIFDVFEVVDVTEVFRDSPMMGILLFSLSFSALLAAPEPCVPREAILPDVLLVTLKDRWI